MGLYLEPQIDKQAWLNANGKLLTETLGYSNIDYRTISENDVLVCNVNNGFFYASAVAFSEDEFKAFNEPDGRPKTWYSVSKELAKSVAPSWGNYFKD